MFAYRKTWMVLITLAILLVGIRITLPWMVEDYVNRTLQEMDEYSGSVEDVDIALWRGAYRIRDIEILKRGADDLEPFFSAPTIELAMQWGRLFEGALVGEITFWQPRVNLVESDEDEESQTGEEEDWQEQFESFFPISVDEIRVHGGAVHFRAPGIDSADAIVIDSIMGSVRNLTNVSESLEEAFTTFDFKGQVYNAPLQVHGRVSPLAATPTFEVNATLEEVSIPDLNPWLEEFVNIDAQAGVFALFLELAAADGYFSGYAKPFSEGIEILDLSDDSKGLLQHAWEAIVDVAASVLENPEDEDVATRVPIRGEIADPETGIWRAVVNTLRHAFVGSFSRSLEHSVSLDNGIDIEPKAQEDNPDNVEEDIEEDQP